MALWYPNTEATSHITNNPENIQHPHVYHGNSQILAIDGSPMPISQFGSSHFTSNSSSFLLKDMLLVPTTTKNLISVN